MRIYFFIKDVSLTGGTERVTMNLASLFSSKGHDVTVVSYYRGKDEPAYKPSSDVKVKYLVEDRCPDKGQWGTRLKFLFKSIASIRRFFESNAIAESDVIISQNFFSNFLIWIAGRARFAIGCEHFKYGVYPKPVRFIRNCVYKSFRQIVTLTEKDAKCFGKHLKKNQVSTIANMVAVDRDIEVKLDSKEIIAVGRLVPQKGFDMLVESAKDVFAKHPDWKLNIFGEGEHRDSLQKKIEKYNLQNHFILKGYSTDITAEFAKSAFFVLSSRFEGFPLVLVEALGLGMPSVAFDCPEGPAILLENGGGKLIPFDSNCDAETSEGFKKNVAQLTDEINYMIENPDFRERCVEHKLYIKEKLSPDVIYEKWKTLFKNLYT